jgi:voltage-gated potassium channel
MVRRLSARLFKSPLIRRIRFYAGRASGQLDRRFFVTLIEGILVIVAIAAVLITLLEKAWTLAALGESFYWGLTTVLGQGQASYVHSPAGWFISWLLILFGVALFGTITGALIAVVIDFLLKEGQGMGASGYEGHVVVCGWNTTARDLIAELRSDVYKRKIVLIAQADKNPAGDAVYYVRGDSTEVADLERAGIQEAASAVVFSDDESNEGDMHSILTVMAVKSVAPKVRTVVEVNNPRHVEHLRRAHADEILVSSQLASRLLARSALYPGLTELVTDIVSGGEGSELYRIAIPDEYLGLTLDEVSARLRSEHRATLLSISRAGKAFVNPPTDFRIAPGDDAVVVAESLGTLAPLVLRHDESPGPTAEPTPGATEGNGHGPVAHDAPSVTPVAPVAPPVASQLTPPTVAPTTPSTDSPAARIEPVAQIVVADPAPPSVAQVAQTAVADPAFIGTQTAVADPAFDPTHTALADPTIVVSRPIVPGGPTIVTISPLPRPGGPPVVAVQPLVAQPPAAVQPPVVAEPPVVAPPAAESNAKDAKRKKKRHGKK